MKIERIACGTANAYLLHGDTSSVLIDTGTKKYKDKVLKRCENANVKLILLTHGHFDHCHNAKYLRNKLKCLVGIAKEDIRLLNSNEKRDVFGKGIWSSFYAWASNCNIQRNNIDSIEADVILKNRMSLLRYGIDGEVIILSGHTMGSCGIMLSSGELFVGDAMQNIIYPSGTWCFENFEQSQKSINLIKTLNANKIFYGHGKVTVKKINID